MARILYLEDEEWQVRNTVVTFIEKELAHTVVLVDSVEKARQELSTAVYDVVFLDIMMDRTKGLIEFENSGLQVAQDIMEGTFSGMGNPSTMPIVIASGVWDATVRNSTGTGWTVEDLAQALGISHRFFLRKPFLVDEVSAVLERALPKGLGR